MIISKDYHDEENNFERDTLAKIMLLGGIEYMWYINGFNSTWSSVLKKSSSNKTSKSLYPRHPLSLSRGKKKTYEKSKVTCDQPEKYLRPFSCFQIFFFNFWNFFLTLKKYVFLIDHFSASFFRFLSHAHIVFHNSLVSSCLHMIEIPSPW